MANYESDVRLNFEVETKEFNKAIKFVENKYKELIELFDSTALDFQETGDVTKLKSELSKLINTFGALHKLTGIVKASFSGIDSIQFDKSINSIADLQKSIAELSKMSLKDIFSKVDENSAEGIFKDLVDNVNSMLGSIKLDSTVFNTALVEAELTSLNNAVTDFYYRISGVGSKITTFKGDKTDLSSIFGNAERIKMATDTLETASSMIDKVGEKIKYLSSLQSEPSRKIDYYSNSISSILDVYEMYVDRVKQLGIEFGKNDDNAKEQLGKFYTQMRPLNNTPNKTTSNYAKVDSVKTDVVVDTKNLVSEVNSEITELDDKLNSVEIPVKPNQEDLLRQDYIQRFNNSVDSIVGEVIDLKQEESKLAKLQRLASELKLKFDAPVDEIGKLRDEMKNLAGEIKIEVDYNNDLSYITNQLGTVKKAADTIRFNFTKTGDVDSANKSLDALKTKLNELKSKRDDLNKAFNKGIISEVEFLAQTGDVDKAIDELENTVVQIDTEINPPSDEPLLGQVTSSSIDLSNLFSDMGDKFNKLKQVVDIVKKSFEVMNQVTEYMVKEFKEAYNIAKNFASAIKSITAGIGNVGNFFMDFSHDALDALGITRQLKDTLSSIGFGDLVGADLLADAIRELGSLLKQFTVDSIQSGSDFQSYYLRVRDTFGEAKNVIYDYAKTSTELLGMSETAFLEASSKIGVFMKPYIKGVDDLANTTVAMTNAIADLSAQTGFSIDDTMSKVLSGLRGNTEAIEELGINVKVADMQTWMETQGLEGKFENLNSEMQNLYRTWYMLDKAMQNGAMGYASRMTNTYAGQVRILTAQFNDLKTVVGTYLTQALALVLPYVNMLLSRLIDVANAIGKVFGLKDKYSLADSLGLGDSSASVDIYNSGIEGIKTGIDSATKAQEGLAKATDKSAKAAKKALAPFHQLNVLQDNSNSGSGGSDGGASGVGSAGLGSILDLNSVGQDMGNLDENVNEWLKKFKEAIEAGEWENAGILLANKVEEMLSSLPAKIEKFFDNLSSYTNKAGRFINGFIAGLFVDSNNDGLNGWQTFGDVLAKTLDGIVKTVLWFTKAISWENLGRGLAQIARHLLTTVDWEAIGKLWSEKTRILIDTLIGFVSELSLPNTETLLTGWQELGVAIGEAIDGMLNNISWEDLGTTIGKALTGISDTILSFLKTFSLSDLAKRITDGINNIFTEFDASKAAQSVAGVVNSIFGALKTAFKNLNWIVIGQDIGNYIGKTLANINWVDVGDSVVGLADGLLDLFINAVYQLQQNFPKIQEGLKTFFDKIIDFISSDENQKAFASGINTLVNMIIGLVNTIDWVKLYQSVSDALRKIDWSSIYYLLKLDDGIKKAFSNIFNLAVFTEIGKNILSLLLTAFVHLNPATMFLAIGYDVIRGFFGGILEEMGIQLPSINEIFGKIIDIVCSIFHINSPSKVFAEIGINIVQGLINGIVETWDTLLTKAKELGTFLINTVKNIFGIHSPSTVFSEMGVNIVQGLQNGFSEKWESFKTKVKELVDGIITFVKGIFGIHSPSTVFAEIGDNIVQGLQNGFSEKWESFKTKVKELTDGIITFVKNIFGIHSPSTVFSGIGGNIVDGFIEGLEPIKEKAVEIFKNLLDLVKTPINAIIGVVESLANSVISGINAIIGALNKFKIDIPETPISDAVSIGFDISTIPQVKIPRLAKGAVINPNQEFLAVLGDQKHGVNIETPLATMLDAFRGALAEASYGNNTDNITIPVYIGNEAIEEIVVNATNRSVRLSNGRY